MRALLVMALPMPVRPSSVTTSIMVLMSSSGFNSVIQPPSTVPPERPVMRRSAIYMEDNSGRFSQMQVLDDSSALNRLIIPDHQLISAKSQRGVCSSIVVAEFDFENTRCQILDDCPHLSTA